MKYSVILLLLILTSSCSTVIVDQEFIQDLGSTNSRLRGELSRYVMKGHLDTLNYNYYINYLRSNERSSGDGLADKIESSDDKYFLADSETFVITLYYEDENVLLSDNGLTERCDTNYNPGKYDKQLLKTVSEKFLTKH